METEQELQRQLLTVKTAIQQLTAGTRLTRVEVGSPEFRRVYEYDSVTMEALQKERAMIQNKLAAFQPQEEQTFRNTAHHVVWDRGL
jgi:hypothetical protein